MKMMKKIAAAVLGSAMSFAIVGSNAAVFAEGNDGGTPPSPPSSGNDSSGSTPPDAPGGGAPGSGGSPAVTSGDAATEFSSDTEESDSDYTITVSGTYSTEADFSGAASGVSWTDYAVATPEQLDVTTTAAEVSTSTAEAETTASAETTTETQDSNSSTGAVIAIVAIVAACAVILMSRRRKSSNSAKNGNNPAAKK